jgi:hypothetical protein
MHPNLENIDSVAWWDGSRVGRRDAGRIDFLAHDPVNVDLAEKRDALWA